MPLAELSTVAQLTGLDAVSIIKLIVRTANTARMHKKNCRQFARHLKLIGNLLNQLNISQLKNHPATRDPLEQLEDALRRSYILVESCQGRSYLYLLAMGWNIVYQFRKAQNEIDRYLKLIPLITLVDNARIRERLEDIEMDQNEYTLDEEDQRVQGLILDPDKNHTSMLKKTLSCSYPRCSFDEALRKENEKLRIELQLSQANLDVHQCEVIQQLLDVTATASTVCQAEKVTNNTKQVVKYEENEGSFELQYSPKKKKRGSPRKGLGGGNLMLTSSSGESAAVHFEEQWRTDLLGCCSDPCLCLKTCFYPCGTFSRIASVAENRYITPGEACNELFAYSLILSCCCYTCCVRRKLRMMLNIKGGVFDDFLSHLMCCCCALVQEWREVEIRGVYSDQKTRTHPPSIQFMEA